MQVITIDGPASSGKGTVAKIIAKQLGFNYLESGAIYRVVGLIADRNNLSIDDEDAVLKLIDNLKLEFIDNKVYVNNENVTDLLRAEKIGMLASKFAKVAEIRTKLMDFQRGFAKGAGLVTDGRDMGSIVFPEANLKIFLTASAEQRAQRRFEQLHKTDKSVTILPILHDIQARDKQDSERKVAPLSYDKSFKILDNSNMSIDETVQTVINWLHEGSV